MLLFSYYSDIGHTIAYMDTIKTALKGFNKLSLKVKLVLFAVLLIGGWYSYTTFFKNSSTEPQYQTQKAERDTLIVSVTASGQISSTNNASATTQSSGVIKEVLVQNGQLVSAGDELVTIDLDQIGQQKYSQALASYQSAKNTLNTEQTKLYILQADMFGKWDTFKELAENSTYTNGDGTPNYTNRALPEFHIPEKEWLAAEETYKNQQNVITQAQNSLNSAWLTLQQSSPTIYAPIAGTVTGLSLQPGAVLITQSNSDSTTSNTSQKVASITTTANPTVTLNLTEIDVTKVKIGNKATITLDAFADKTYTGRVVSIDTVGSVSSGVTSYPTVIQLDLKNENILPNMSASASIITETKDNVILVPASAVQTTNGESTVKVMKNGQIEQIPVETGSASDTQIEIRSGISEGDTIVTSTTTSGQTGTQTQSSFSPFGGSNRGFSSGGAVRISR